MLDGTKPVVEICKNDTSGPNSMPAITANRSWARVRESKPLLWSVNPLEVDCDKLSYQKLLTSIDLMALNLEFHPTSNAGGWKRTTRGEVRSNASYIRRVGTSLHVLDYRGGGSKPAFDRVTHLPVMSFKRKVQHCCNDVRRKKCKTKLRT